MKKYFLISIFGFALSSFQANAQCCAVPSNKKTIAENSNQENGKTVEKTAPVSMYKKIKWVLKTASKFQIIFLNTKELR